MPYGKVRNELHGLISLYPVCIGEKYHKNSKNLVKE